ncbi:hypothetical protein FJTKL_14512 [Diaporthe vaccinii]|uniref:Peptidase S8/S53 domain-containing protein n=1 Tax=Diaporthe vaccinii TaxID=105482 RepID=A0ABR4E7P6_9PEZI
MISSIVSALLLSGFALAQAQGPDTGLQPADPPNAPFGTRYVVEFSKTGSAKFRARDGSMDTEGFYQSIAQETNITAKPALNFTSSIFHGASFDLANETAATDLEEIKALPGVVNLWPVATVYASPQIESTGVANFSQWSPHILTRVNEARSLGYDGKGVVIAVVDSGIDYFHPSLGGGFGKGFKVESDDDPIDCLGHGTHIAGIAASSNDKLPGVAPNATLRAYKVFGCSDGTTEDIIALAFIRAFEEGADIITASLGSSQGFPEVLSAQIVTRIASQGVFASVAAGNSGERGPFSTSSLGNGYIPLNPPDVCSLDVPWDGALPTDTIAVLPRGRAGLCSDGGWQIMDSALIDRATWVFFINWENVSYERPSRVLYTEGQATGFASINYDDGAWLNNQTLAGENVTFEFKYDPAAAIGVDYFTNMINDSSSWGPTLDVRQKPEISAPGGQILSTWPTSKGSCAVLSGTSMATPYIAGVAALFYQSAGGRSALGSNPAQVAHTRLVSSGSSVLHHNGSTTLQAGKASFDVVFTAPTDIDASLLPIYGGFVHIIGDNGEVLKATYLGVHGSLYNAKTWELERGVPVYFGAGGYGDTFEDGRVFDSNQATPEVYYNLLWATREHSFDLVSVDWNETDWVYPQVAGKNKWFGSLQLYDALNEIYFPYPFKYYPRSLSTFQGSVSTKYSDGTPILNGEYRILGRALKTFGEPENPQDWQFGLSNWLVVNNNSTSNGTIPALMR